MLYKSVMLLGSCLGEGLEPVGVMAATVIDCPLLHTLGHAIGDTARQWLLVVNSIDERVVGGERVLLEHFRTVKHFAGVISLRSFLGNLYGYRFAVGSLLNDFES